MSEAPFDARPSVRAQLHRLGSLERAKRLILVGLVLSLYGVGWLVVGARASRFAESVCRVERVPFTRACAAFHQTNDGRRHGSVWDSCERPSRWPPTPVGESLPCFYWVSDPGQITFARPAPVPWARPEIIGLASLGGGTLAAGLVLLGRARRRSDGDDPHQRPQPYRDPPPAEPPGPRPCALLVHVVEHTHFVQKIVGSGFLATGVTLGLAALVFAPIATGTIGIVEIGIVALSQAATLVGLLGLGYRSGLVVDPESGMLWTFWGLWGATFRRRAAIADVVEVAAFEVFRRYGVSVSELRITFVDHQIWSLRPSDVGTAVAQVRSSVAAAREPT